MYLVLAVLAVFAGLALGAGCGYVAVSTGNNALWIVGAMCFSIGLGFMSSFIDKHVIANPK
jgi:hypothetical protein